MSKDDIDAFEAAAARRPRKGGTCAVTRVLGELPPARVGALLAAMERPSLTAAGISDVLTEWGHDVPAFTIARHRRGDCRCS